ncbi:MAG: AAA family ATPase [Chloroflexi bacterium CG07_land_8_20_14_0_80_45_17]|nr:MAG: AAA family ATPase [Chloroflexi bacterium CG23_combo_of_CG06-09_8_20_14_all_45_10]PIU56789.1 MAG: AAA family ATPase [Chloroflexi bacterium CG07_land_8_20_14_0_80_45_17]
MDILATLNPVQREAVEATEGPVLILAGPGSGKTRVITHRVAYLVRGCGVNPHHIMAVTFTNKAAREMKERLEQLLGQAVEALTLGTFHAICARILRCEGKATGLNAGFVIYDDEDQLKLIKQSLQEINLDPKQYAPRALQSAISAAKSRLISAEGYAQQIQSYFEEVVQRVYQHYQQLLSQSGAVDFDDLLMKTVELFRNHPQILNRYQSRYLHILVDEFQDTNIAQYMLIKQLAGKHHNICVVGDPDQSIYSWRFADLRNILSFEKDYPEAKVVVLEQNYRSTKTILEVASDVISANVQRKPKNLWTENEVGSPVAIIESYSEEEEAQSVVNEIEKLVSQEQISLKDCAVMYRVNAQSRALEETFMRYGLPYKLVGGTRFYRRQEVKDIIAYLRVIHNPHDNVSLARMINVPGRGIGQGTLSQLRAWARSHDTSLYDSLKQVVTGKALSPRITQALSRFTTLIDELMAKSHGLSLAELLDEILEHIGYREYLLEKEDGEDRWENIMELKSVAREYSGLNPEEALATFLEKISLVADIDELDEKADAVTLITLHQAKGLEFPVVFIVGMEEGILPHRKSFDDPEEMEEERRLCYVGMTRAEKQLYLLHSYRRSLFGGSVNPPSRFLQDISPHLVTTQGLWEEESLGLPATVYSQSPINSLSTLGLKVGDWVHHSKFGDGIVMDCLPDRGDQVVTVAFEEAGVKKLLLSLAKLEKIEKDIDFP